MQHSDAPWKELARAENELGAMKAATDVRVRLEHWIEFMRAIDRLWNKAEGTFSRSPKWPAWGGRYIRMRRADPLLSYLVQARNVEEHSPEPSAEARPMEVSIGGPSPDGAPTWLKGFAIGMNGEVLFRDGTTPIKVDPPSVEPKEVEQRGVRFKPPQSHLGEPISTDVITMAEAGVAFYRTFLIAAEAKFVDAK